MTPGRLRALLLLAWALVVTLAKKVFGSGPRGLALFRSNYDPDHLRPLSSAERATVAGHGRCIACGRCNVGDGERIAASNGAYPGTMAVMLASSRSIPDFGAAAEALRWVSDDDLAKKEQICPTRVPMRQIASFIRAHASG
jgi:succinate dehydrogenase/fumarate reductase-like Fe-S protein